MRALNQNRASIGVDLVLIGDGNQVMAKGAGQARPPDPENMISLASSRKYKKPPQNSTCAL